MIEIERKFLAEINDEYSLRIGPRMYQTQGYLSFDPVVRIRIQECPVCEECQAECGSITIKGKGELLRAEYEYNIKDTEEARELLKMCKGYIIHKQRFWQDRYTIDIYEKPIKGLVIVEVELKSEDEPLPPVPKCINLLQEVTYDNTYKNSEIARMGITI